MAKTLTPAQQRLIDLGYATPADFGVSPEPQEVTLLDQLQAYMSDPEAQAAAQEYIDSPEYKERATAARLADTVNQRRAAEAYDAEGPGILSSIVNSVQRGYGNRQADSVLLDGNVAAGQIIDPVTGLPATDEQLAGSSVAEAEGIRRNNLANNPGREVSKIVMRDLTKQIDSGRYWDAAKTAVGNPMATAELVGESLGYQAPELALTAAAPASRLLRALGVGATTYTPAQKGYMSQALDEASGGDPSVKARLLADKEFMAGLEDKARRYAGTMSVLSAGTAGMAGTLTRGATTMPSLVGRTSAEAGLQTVAEGLTEGASLYAAGDEVKTSDMVIEAMAGMPNTAVDVSFALADGKEAVRNNVARIEQERILEARERARRMNTPTAENIADAFEAGIRDAADSGPQQLDLELPGADEIAPSVGGAIEAETTAALESELAARQPEPVTPLNRLSREADTLRSTIETAAEAPEALNEVEQANVADSIDRLNEVESRMENIDREPTQPDLFNVVTDPNIGAIEDTRRKIAEDDAKAKAKAEEKQAMKEQADLRKFRTDFLRNNPEATNEQVLAAESKWRASRTAAPAPAATTKTKAIDTAPSVKPEEDSEGVTADVANILRQPRRGRTVGPKASADLSGIEVDEGDSDFDPGEIDEPDIRAQAEANPNLRRHLSGTAFRPIMYHGTRKDADIGVWETGDGQLGVHMSANPAGVPKQFADRAPDGGKIMRLAVNIKNALRLRDDGDWSVHTKDRRGDYGVAHQLLEMGKIDKAKFDSVIKEQQAIRDGIANDSISYDDGVRQLNDLGVKLLQDLGYDGVIYQNRYEVPGLGREELFQRLLDNGIRPERDSISALSDGEFKAIFPETDQSMIALTSNQVKDVDNNSGEYDSANPNVKAAADMRSYRKNLADKTEAFPPMSAERRLIEAHATATTPAKRIAAAFDFIEDTLGNTVNDQFLRNFVLPALRKLAPLIRDITIYPDKQSLQYDGGMARGLFFPDTGKIEIARGGMSAKVMIHEMLHAATWGALRNPKFVESDANVAAAVAGINKVRDLVQSWVNNGGVKRLPDGEAKRLLTKGVGRLIDAKGNVDIDELITYIFTEPSIQQAFRQIKAPGMLRNAWRTAVDSIRKFLGLKEKDYDAVDAMLVEGTELLRALSDNPNSPTSRETIATTEFRKYGDGTLDMAADVAEATAPKAMLAGVEALTAPLDKLADAKAMEKDGKGARAIWRETGWAKGADGKWRFEIPDTNATLDMDKLEAIKHDGSLLKQAPSTSLGEVLNHPKLFENYPSLRDIVVTYKPAFLDVFRSFQGWFNPEDMTLNITPYAQDKLSTMLHEIQHAVQQIENFAAGGNSQAVVKTLTEQQLADKFAGLISEQQTKYEGINERLSKIRDILSRNGEFGNLERDLSLAAESLVLYRSRRLLASRDENYSAAWELDSKVREASKRLENIIERVREHVGVDTSPVYLGLSGHKLEMLEYTELGDGDVPNIAAAYEAVGAFMDALGAAVTKLEQEGVRQLDKLNTLRNSDPTKAVADAYGYDLYRKLAGEAEARNVQTRATMPEEQLRETAPEDTQDVPTDEQIVTFGSEESASQVAPKAAAEPVDTRAPVDVATKLVSKRSVGGMGVDTATGKTATGLRGRVNRLLRGSKWAGPEATTEVLVNADGLTAAGMIELRVQYDEMRKLVADNGSKFFDKKGDHWEKFITMMDNFENAKTEEEKNVWADDLRNAFGQRTLDILENMRTRIDERSVDLIHQLYDDAPVDSEGNKILSKDLTRQLNAIAANLGKYNHRSYAVFDKKLAEQHRLWLSNSGPGRVVYDRAVQYLTKNDVSIPADDVLDTMSREALERRAALWTTTKEGLPLEDLRNGLREVRDNPQAYNQDAINYNAIRLADDIINNRKTNATRIYLSERADQTILKKREDVPKELRALMGENADPGFRVLQTVLKQDKLLNKLKAFREISDRFNGTYVFDNRNDAPSNFVQLGSTDLGALANKFVHPDVAAALETTTATLTTLETMFDNPQNFTAGLAQGAGKAVRGLKGFILLSAGLGYAFNLAGSFLTILANGHAAKLVTDPTVMKEAIQTIVENNKALATGKFTPRVEEMFRRVINDPAMTGEMQQISIADAVARVYEREAIDTARTRFNKYVAGPAGWAWDRAFDLYAAMDMWAKVYNYYAEVAELRGLNEVLPADQKMDEERLRRTAAERVRQSNLSYERAFPAVRTLDQTGITMFSTYTAEVFRSLGAGTSLVNSDIQLASEMEAAGNTEAAAYLRKMAAKRGAGLAGVTLAGGIAGKAVTSGVASLLVMAGILGEADYDEEEEEAILEMAKIGTPWMADRAIGVVGTDPATGKPVVMDMGRGNPYDPAVNAMRLIAEGDVLGAAKSTAGGISPLLGFGMGTEGSRTRTPRTVREGGPVATMVARLSATDTLSRESSFFLLNLAEMYAPTQLEELMVKDDFTLADGLGYRPVTADPVKYLGRGGLGREIAGIRNSLSADLKDMSVLRDDAMLDAVASQAVARELEMFRKASTAVGLARQLGVAEKDIKDALEGASVRRDVARGLRRENFVPSILSEEVLNRAKKDALEANPEDKTEINARFRELKRKLRERRRQALLEEKE